MTDRCRLLVVGAGPAGSYAALTAARGGLEVILVERDPEVGRPLSCAEGISARGLSNFVDPDPAFISADIYAIGFTVATGFEFTCRADERFGYILDRPTFDRYLAETAASCGADLRMQTFACGIRLRDDGPADVALQTPAGTATVRADYVIAADGVESMIGRMAGLETGLALDENESALQYRVTGIDIERERLEFCVGERYSPDGYLWVFPKSDHSANVGLGLNPEKTDARELRVLLDRFLADRYGRYTVEFESCGMVPKFIGLDILGRDNLLLAGDASRTLDSLTGAGIAKAMHTGQLAARAILAAVDGTIERRELVSHYRSSVDREMGRELRFYRTAHGIFRKFSDEDWESLARFLQKYLAKEKAGSFDPAAMVKSALTGAPRLLRLARHIL